MPTDEQVRAGAQVAEEEFGDSVTP